MKYVLRVKEIWSGQERYMDGQLLCQISTPSVKNYNVFAFIGQNGRLIGFCHTLGKFALVYCILV